MTVANALGAKKDGGWRGDLDNDTYVTATLRAEGFDAGEDGTGRGTPLVPEVSPAIKAFDTTQITSKGNYSSPQPGDPCHPLAANAHAPAVAAPLTSCYGKTLDHAGSKGSGPENAVIQGMAVRRLTPRECERLQGFPDDHTLIEFKGKPAADGPRYRAIGNSMAVLVMRWLGRRIAMVDRILQEANA